MPYELDASDKFKSRAPCQSERSLGPSGAGLKLWKLWKLQTHKNCYSVEIVTVFDEESLWVN